MLTGNRRAEHGRARIIVMVPNKTDADRIDQAARRRLSRIRPGVNRVLRWIHRFHCRRGCSRDKPSCWKSGWARQPAKDLQADVPQQGVGRCRWHRCFRVQFTPETAPADDQGRRAGVGSCIPASADENSPIVLIRNPHPE